MGQIITKIKENGALIATILLSIVAFCIKMTPSVLDVTYTDWLAKLSLDPQTELISWNYYRHSPWTFPVVGRMEGYDYPTVTGIGMTGIVAPLAIFFKAIAPIMPANFHYFGWWFLICFVMQGYFGLKLIKNLCNRFSIAPPQYLQVISTLFLILAPAMLHRTGHMHMFAHFTVVAALALYFDTTLPLRRLGHFVLLSAFTAGVSQYLTLMVMCIALASFVDMTHRRLIPIYAIFFYGLSVLVAVLGVFYITGDFVMPLEAVQTDGFGKFSANMNTFWNPQEYGALYKGLPMSTDGQYEGFGYLGVGFMGLFIFSLLLLQFQKWNNKQAKTVEKNPEAALFYPIVFMAVLFFIYALSCKIGLNGQQIHRWYYGDIAAKFFDSLRASGRFIWLPYYTLMAFGLVFFLKIKMNNTLKTSLLSLFLILQIIDNQKLIRTDREVFKKFTPEENHYLKWKPLFAEASRVIVFPPYDWNILRPMDMYTFSRAASENGKAITDGYYARRDHVLIRRYEKKLYDEWAINDLGENDNAIFVGNKKQLWRFDTLVKSGKLQCYTYQDYAVLIPPTLHNTRNYLEKKTDAQKLPFNTEGVVSIVEKYKNNTILIVAMEEAANKLDLETKAKFMDMGATELRNMAFAGAYICILHKGKAVFEQLDNQHIIEKKWDTHTILKDTLGKPVFTFKKPITLSSGGAYMGRSSKMMIGDKDHSPNKRGLNFVILNDAFEVIDVLDVDTYEGAKRTKLQKK
jgi:hypothetical protein